MISFADRTRERITLLAASTVGGFMLFGIPEVYSQELEPRAYSPAPVGTNFLALGYAYTEGNVVVDSSLPLNDVSARIHTLFPGYVRTFDLLGRSASVGVVAPLFRGNVEGNVFEERKEVTRDGLGDIRMRLSTNLLGGDPLTPEEFAKEKPTTILGASLSAVAPTGEYSSERLINLGSNRWAFKPEVGGSKLLEDFFLDGSVGTWLYTDNPKFYGNVRRSQDPILSIQAHGGYTFSPGLWMAGDATYYTGGQTTVGGVEKNDRQENTRYGATLAVPLSQSFSLKFSWSQGLTTRIGGDFNTVAASIQYRWFDS